MSWNSVLLEKVAVDLQPGFACQPTIADHGVPQLRTNNVSPEGGIDLSELKYVPATPAQIDKYSLRPGDILFNNTNSPALVGKTAFFDESGRFLFSNHMTRMRVDETLADPRYIARFLHWAWSQGAFRALVTQWVNQAAINRDQLASVRIPLPPPSEQRRIAEILDQADRLRRLRAEADAKAGRILPALFVKMFGDPGRNPFKWETGQLGDAIRDTQYGTSKRANSEGIGVPVIRMNNIWPSGAMDLADLKFVDLDRGELERLRLEAGDILFNWTNSADLVGKTGIWSSEAEAVPASYLIRIRVHEEKASPEYLWAFMNTPFMKAALRAKARRAIGMANINATELRRLPAVFPPRERQLSFVRFVRNIREFEGAGRNAGRRLAQMFSLLLCRAFSGELTADWREAHIEELLQEIEQQACALRFCGIPGNTVKSGRS